MQLEATNLIAHEKQMSNYKGPLPSIKMTNFELYLREREKEREIITSKS